MASTAALSAAAQDRKSRLAQLKSLKRKQAPTEDENDFTSSHPTPSSNLTQDEENPRSTDRYLSGRNYDPTTKGPKLGFESAPSQNNETLEAKASRLAEETRERARKEEEEEKPLDLFKLQPKKANWDLKRDLERKMEVLGVRTDNAVARLVRERLGKVRGEVGGKRQDGDGVGMEGKTLVEATHVREREDEEEARREREEDEALGEGS